VICVEFVAGVVQVVDPQPTDFSTCQAILMSPADWQSLFTSSLAGLTAEQGAGIGGGIALVFAIAWSFRRLVDAFWHNG
jgi:hypothetical protein